MHTLMMNLALWAQFQPPRPGGNQLPNFQGAQFDKAMQDAGSTFVTIMIWFWIIVLLLLVPTIIGMWKVFAKAGEPGWAALIPVYQWMVAAKVGGKSEVYGLLTLVPFIGIIFAIIICIDVANKFGQGAGYGIGLVFLPIIFWPLLGFGGAEYEDDRSRRRRRVRVEEDEDEDEDNRPRKRRTAAIQEDDDDRPRRRRPVAQDDEDEEPRPRRKPDPRIRKREDRDED
jgi:uncharacterized membrane protein YhaH (DUF805 family)